MSELPYDFLIVGQGIAGTCLAWQLIDRGQRVLILNDTSRPSASLVAAGIYNPLTGRNLVKTWMADELFPYAENFYGRLEELVGAPLVHSVPIYRPFRSEEEKIRYATYASEPAIAAYIKGIRSEQPDIQGLYHPWGGLEVRGCGWVDLNTLVQKSREKFIENNQYLEGTFDPKSLIIKEDQVEWQGIKSRKILFCQGFKDSQDSLFGWLPFNPVKGQILDLTFAEYSSPMIVNQGIFILPGLQEGTFRVGATYSWHDLDWISTQDGREYLEAKLEPLVQGTYAIQHQLAGIRPSSKDRRPLIGLHPQYGAVGIFNGLGTKGVTLAPFFSAQFAEHLVDGKELNPEVNIDRYFSLYYQ